MAGTSKTFNSTKFRSAIQGVYEMAAAVNTADQATFYFPTSLVYDTTGVDGGGVPFDPNSTVTRVVPDPVKVPCGVEYFDSAGQVTVFGDTVPSRVEITVLDEDFVKIEGCLFVVLGGERFKFSHMEPPSGLFDVGLYTMHFKSENAT